MENRINKSFEENKKYIDKLIKNNQDDVISLVNKWIKKSGIEEFCSSVFKIDLRGLNQLVTTKNCNDSKVSVESAIRNKVKELENKILEDGFKDTDFDKKSEKHYLWITFRADGMVVTVGKTNMENNDLLKYEDLYSAGTGNTRVVLQHLLKQEDRKRFNEINEELYNYSQSAIIVGIKSKPVNKKQYSIYTGEIKKKIPDTIELECNNSLGSFVIKLESLLRKFLYANNINVLNKES